LLKFVDNYFIHEDDRGSIKGLVNFGNWKELNLIESKAGCIRGNHYHKTTTELFLILKGEIKIQTQQVINGQLEGKVEENIVTKGKVFLIEPFINHTFIILKDSKWINVLSDSKSSEDIHRI